MVNILGFIEIPLLDIVLMTMILFLIGRWYISRMVSTHKVSFLLIAKTGLEGRLFKAEESLAENRVSYFKSMGRRKKPERIDFERRAGPLNQYIGSRRDSIFKSTDGLGYTTSWLDDKDSESMPSLIYEETGKFRSMVNNLTSVAMKNNSERFMNILMGVFIGMRIFILAHHEWI